MNSSEWLYFSLSLAVGKLLNESNQLISNFIWSISLDSLFILISSAIHFWCFPVYNIMRGHLSPGCLCRCSIVNLDQKSVGSLDIISIAVILLITLLFLQSRAMWQYFFTASITCPGFSSLIPTFLSLSTLLLNLLSRCLVWFDAYCVICACFMSSWTFEIYFLASPSEYFPQWSSISLRFFSPNVLVTNIHNGFIADFFLSFQSSCRTSCSLIWGLFRCSNSFASLSTRVVG